MTNHLKVMLYKINTRFCRCRKLLHYFLKNKKWKLIKLSPVGVKIYQPKRKINKCSNHLYYRVFQDN